ncbi:MAG: Lysyl endopeptidase precursor [Candidatus Hydrogenedentes bacterium ADurb.Bin101]|nr:MAG: Lysyl endopeptidase precursor [Candidatus Hydrogenedentes bacterium ADurb.Bin101]
MLFRFLMPALALCLVAGILAAEEERYFADYYYVPAPAKTADGGRDATGRARHALTESLVREYVGEAMPVLDVQAYTETGVTVKALESASPNQVAWGAEINEDAGGVFGGPVVSGDGSRFFLASVESRGAFALRVRADLHGLLEDEALYVLDGEGRASFGPYTVTDAATGGNWLPTTLGERVVLALCSPRAYCPLMRIETVSHFYKSIFNGGVATSLTCNIPVAMEGNPDACKIASGVGILIIPYGAGQGYCTGSLLTTQVPTEPTPESYLLSSWHCFDSGVDYSGMEVFWDYRSESDDPNLLLRNRGAQLLSYNEVLDAALLKLNEPVAAGPHGRAWLGWDTLRPVSGDLIQTIHHPRADSMKTSRGTVTAIAKDTCLDIMCTREYAQQVEVLWTEGVTEQGSSGSPLLYRELNYRILGTLSNGPSHSCTDTSGNFDNYSSFSLFFPQIQCYLAPGLECQEPYASSGDDRCFIVRLFFPKADTVENLRCLRDTVLVGSPLGKQVIKGYYQCCPALECWLSRDSLARTAFKGVLTLGDAWGGVLRGAREGIDTR